MAAGADLLPAQVRTLLATPLVERGEHLGQLVKLTNALAAEFFGALSEAQHLELARLWHFRCFASGEDICSASEECEFLFVVLAGTCELYERRVAHLDELSGTDGHKRHVVARRGYAFGHHPRHLPASDAYVEASQRSSRLRASTCTTKASAQPLACSDLAALA